MIVGDFAQVLLTAALNYAKRGIPVFPCSPKDKRPLVRGGFKAATCDTMQISKWWRRWPDAMIGVPTGTASGIDVLDIDNKNGKNGFAALGDWQRYSPVIVRTPSDGAHLYFKSHGTIRNSASKLAEGLDVRGDGGYVIVPPSKNSEGKKYRFELRGMQEKKELPVWPKDLPLDAPKRATRPTTITAPVDGELGRFCAELGAATEGTRNDTLNRTAFGVGRLVAAGLYDEPTARTHLIEAARSVGLGDQEILATVNSALAAGQKIPDGYSEDQWLEITRLVALPRIQYDRQRKEVAKRFGMRVTTLDALIETLRPHAADDNLQGTPLVLPVPEPWPEAVDGGALVIEMTTAISRHVALSEEQSLAVALWVIHSHAQHAAEHFPRLHVASPEPRCGKTTLLRTIFPMLTKPLNTANITTSALFRVIEKGHPTLLIDEADTFLKKDNQNENQEMRGILNAGHSRGGTVIRTVGEAFEPREFHVAGPVVIAGIGQIPATLEDRSITISLRRRLAEENIERLRSNRTDHLSKIGQRVARWVEDNGSVLVDADPDLPEKLDDRAQDNWRPLVAIGDLISPAVGRAARDAAVHLAQEEMSDNESAGIMVLADVAAIFELKSVDRLTSHEIVSDLCQLEGRPWAEWRRGQPLTVNGLARLLKPFRIRPKGVRFSPKPASPLSGYLAEPIRQAKARYVDKETELEDGIPAAVF